MKLNRNQIKMKIKYFKYYILFALIYFGQGIYHLPYQSLELWLKKVMGLGVDKVAYISAFATIPWTIKPLYGIISDTFPICGYRRKSYLIINYILIVLTGLYIFSYGLTISSLLIINVLCAIAFAMNDVCCDSIMVEKGQEFNMTGVFQSVQWGASSIASVLVGLFGGLIAQYLNYQIAYLFVSIVTIGILLFLVKNYKEKKRTEKINTKSFIGIKKAIKNKQLWLALVFLFCLWFSPSFGLALRWKMRDVLHFNELFIGLLGTTGAGFGILGAIIYGKICRKVPLKKLLTWSIIFSGATTFCFLYYPNWIIALVYAILFGIFGMISHLVVLDYSAKITPKEAEGFAFAGICSILNLSGMLSGVVGGFLYPIIGLNWLIIISGTFTLLCLFFIPHLKLEIKNEDNSILSR